LRFFFLSCVKVFAYLANRGKVTERVGDRSDGCACNLSDRFSGLA
jgi:hypothetical protein